MLTCSGGVLAVVERPCDRHTIQPIRGDVRYGSEADILPNSVDLGSVLQAEPQHYCKEPFVAPAQLALVVTTNVLCTQARSDLSSYRGAGWPLEFTLGEKRRPR